MLKNFAVFTLCILLVFSVFPFSASAVSGRTSIQCSSTNPTVGDTITVTVNFSTDTYINAAEGLLLYSADVLEYIAGSNTNLMEKGKVKFVTMGSGTTTFAFSVDFKVIGGGVADIVADECIVSEGTGEYSLTSSSVSVAVNKTLNTAVCEKPNVSYYSYNCVSLNNYENMEYSMDGENWQLSPYFGGLEPSTAYTFYQRYRETDTHFASEKSVALSFSTASVLENKIGDVNNNNAVDVADLALLKKVIAGINLSLNSSPVFYDVDQNGSAPNVADLATLKKIIAGLL